MPTKLSDNFIELMGDCYRAMCGVNDVLIVDGWVITFEGFLHRVCTSRAARGLVS